ncbi:hypothetical protein [Leucobacter aridicollis]|uniref:hypothetical protein n=1 Tax=Leucobacter aridicollis TaxID=283878 RepID=UPI0021070F07|nr:hypothetical protein [Leucobacter aridicollis]UTX53756.1 hypothetical protein KI794_03200 [Leucobacter aridicollis]
MFQLVKFSFKSLVLPLVAIAVAIGMVVFTTVTPARADDSFGAGAGAGVGDSVVQLDQALESGGVEVAGLDGQARTLEKVPGAYGDALQFEFAEGDNVSLSPDKKSLTISNAAGQVLLAFDSPELRSPGDPEVVVDSEILIEDGLIQVVPSGSSFVEGVEARASCFASWLGSLVVSVGSGVLVCLPLGLANVAAGIACTVAMGVGSASLDYDKACR